MNEHLKAMALWGGLCVLLCSVFYLSSNCIAETYLSHHRLYLEWEKDIPQVPGMILFYQSYSLLVLLSFIQSPFNIMGNGDLTVGHSHPSTSPVRYRNRVCFGMDHLEICLSQA